MMKNKNEKKKKIRNGFISSSSFHYTLMQYNDIYYTQAEKKRGRKSVERWNKFNENFICLPCAIN
jgi:tyrosyl-tRNA synthetase